MRLPQRRFTRFLFVLAAAAILAAGVILLLMATNPGAPHHDHKIFHSTDDVLVIAHQGGNHLRPDNTMPAFEYATALGVDVLEMDVHGTADGELVVIHDDTVDRTTNGTGAVKEITLAELQALDAAYNWPHHRETDEYPYRGQGVTIPTLREVLQAFPDMPMVIEIKQREPSIVYPFGEMLREFDREGRVIVASFHPQTMYEFREAFPEFATAAVEPEVRTFYVLSLLLMARVYRPPFSVFQVPERSGGIHVVRPRFLYPARMVNVETHVWTVNAWDDMRRLLSLGVDGIITDRPDLLLGLLGR